MEKVKSLCSTLLVAFLLISLVVSCKQQAPPMPEPPVVPAEVLSVWNSPPSGQGFPPNILKSITLQPYGETGDYKETERFFLPDGQWIDIILESSDTLINFGEQIPGRVFSEITYHHPDGGTGHVGWGNEAKVRGFVPNWGKWLFDNKVTELDKGTNWSTAMRHYAWAGAGNYSLYFKNFYPNNQVEITYKIYKLATTPDWGGIYHMEQFVPWLDAIFKLPISDDEKLRIVEDYWYKQFE